MTISLTEKELMELWVEARYSSLQNPEPDEFIYQVPKQLGKGYVRDIEVYPHLWLTISDYEYHNDVLIKSHSQEHPVQFGVLLSGKARDDNGQFGEGYTLISGSGIQRQWNVEIANFQRIVSINIHLPPQLLATFFPRRDGQIPTQLRLLLKGNDWQTLIYPETTTAIQGVAQQIVNCPYQGITKQMYLQGKILELMALQLASILADLDGLQPLPRLKPRTIAQIYHAKDILLSRVENPPSLLELAQLVGVSDRTLKRGFRELFNTTVFGYLTDKRMKQAEQLLRGSHLSIAEVANLVGYSHQGHFAAAFKRKFGITPGECLLGKKSLTGL
ncbi:MAG: AraC family transcriptional regulator [Rhizonema sp. PD37]|nr:AraC family transcriptional regulator [Rhizonema sp. PD37]